MGDKDTRKLTYKRQEAYDKMIITYEQIEKLSDALWQVASKDKTEIWRLSHNGWHELLCKASKRIPASVTKRKKE